MRDATTDGLLLVDKPAGVTSHDVVLAARRAVGEKRAGHAGTLDPFATGLLVLLFGRVTDTDDLDGATIREAAPPSDEAIMAALPQLTGTLHQVPPVYSAKRVAGRRAYKAARAGNAIALAPAVVDVFAWRDLRRQGDTLYVTIACGAGTYIRALARDLGRLTDSAAHLSVLRRVRSGAFHVRDAVTFGQLGAGDATLRPALDALPTLPRIILPETDAERVLRGIAVDRDVASTQPRAALVDARSGALLALAVADGVRWQPRVVMHRVG